MCQCLFHLAWENIYPKLLPLLESTKAAAIKQEILDKLILRRREFLPFWKEYVANVSDEKQRLIMPNFKDAADMDIVKEMLSEDAGAKTVTRERWLCIVRDVSSQVADFQIQVQHDLIKLLHPPSPSKYHPVADSVANFGIGAHDPNQYLRILDRATSVFKCYLCDSCLSYPMMFEHEHIRSIRRLRWARMRDHIFPSEDMQSTVRESLKKLGLPEDAPRAALEFSRGEKGQSKDWIEAVDGSL